MSRWEGGRKAGVGGTHSCDGLGGVDVVSGDHAHHDPGHLCALDGVLHVASQGVDDADDAVAHQVGVVGRVLLPALGQLGERGEVAVGDAERAQGCRTGTQAGRADRARVRTEA